MKRKPIHLLSSIINETGFHVSRQPDHNTWRLVIVFSQLLSAMISLGMYSFQRYGNFDEFIIPTTYETVGIALLGNLLVLFCFRQTISEMLYQMDDNIFTYPDESSLNIVYPSYLREENIINVSYVILCLELSALFVIDIPMLADLIFRHKINPSMYPCWTPWTQGTPLANLFTLIIQIIQGIACFWVNYIVMTTLFVTVCEFLRQHHRLRFAIITLKQRTTESLNEKKSQVKDEELVMRNHIISCIQHHQMLQKNFKLFKTWFSVLFSIELASLMMTLIFGFYCFVNVTNLGNFFNYLGVAMIVNATLLVKCLIGEIFSDMNAQLADAILYDLEWWEMSVDNQRMLATFHRIINRPFNLFGFSIVKANRTTYGSIIRFTYSSFNIINLAVKK